MNAKTLCSLCKIEVVLQTLGDLWAMKCHGVVIANLNRELVTRAWRRYQWDLADYKVDNHEA